MNTQCQIVTPGPKNTVIDKNGVKIIPPADWDFLPAGDAGITRKVTSKGLFWRVQVKKGRRFISKGVWAPAATIEHARKTITALRATDEYARKMTKNRERRERIQAQYSKEFHREVRNYLSFAPQYIEFEKNLATAVTDHAIPVGSGTVARTSMIPIEERAAKAVIAWMRHQTTAYDSMKIARIKGQRRKIRRMLAQHSVHLLEKYRNGEEPALDCPLRFLL
ncbi:MAG: DUF2293 domain-containing protein [Desulfobulbaceae bacterium]|nr:DUF2293 domain-containing protein [Desulfobulbaceae bacterium]